MKHSGIMEVEIIHGHKNYSVLIRVLSRHLEGVDMAFLIMAFQNDQMA